jgi:hypothetical protein
VIQIDPELSRRLANVLSELNLSEDEIGGLIDAAEKAKTFNALPDDIQIKILEAEADYGLGAPYDDPDQYPDGPPSKGTVVFDG